MADFLLFVGALGLCMGAVYGASRYVGNGVCHDCGRLCPPWSVYCWRHNPFNEPQDD